MAERILYTELTSCREEKKDGKNRRRNVAVFDLWPTTSSLKYLFGKADVSETLLDGVKLLGVEFAGDDVLHHPAVLTFDVPAGRNILILSRWYDAKEKKKDEEPPNKWW